MLAYISGTLMEVGQEDIIIECGGLGYQVTISSLDLAMLKNKGETIKLYLYMSVRENDIRLYGFVTQEAKLFFQQLLNVSGLGPKGAMAILSAMPIHEMQMAILSGDVKSITKANGIGPKVAQRIIVELKDKIKPEHIMASPDLLDIHNRTVAPGVIQALVELGYSQSEAANAVTKVSEYENMSEEELLKAALRKLI